MNTLHLFGDSYTEGHNMDFHYHNYKNWREYRGGDLPETWGEMLSNKLNMLMNNKAVAGMGNYEIFLTICQHSDMFKKDDIVIINWTFMERFRWASIHKGNDGTIELERDINGVGHTQPYWKRLSSKIENGHHINENTRNDIAINRTDKLYVDEIYNYEKIIELLCKNVGCDVYFWSSDSNIIYSLPKDKLKQKKYILHDFIDVKSHLNINLECFFTVIRKHGGMDIANETNFKVQDTHLGETGHKVQSELFYDYIKLNKINLL